MNIKVYNFFKKNIFSKSDFPNYGNIHKNKKIIFDIKNIDKNIQFNKYINEYNNNDDVYELKEQITKLHENNTYIGIFGIAGMVGISALYIALL